MRLKSRVIVHLRFTRSLFCRAFHQYASFHSTTNIIPFASKPTILTARLLPYCFTIASTPAKPQQTTAVVRKKETTFYGISARE